MTENGCFLSLRGTSEASDAAIQRKEHSRLETQQRYFMNLHEECLLKYLKSPDELSYSTDILKLNNQILEQHFLLENMLTKNLNLGYNNSH